MLIPYPPLENPGMVRHNAASGDELERLRLDSDFRVLSNNVNGLFSGTVIIVYNQS